MGLRQQWLAGRLSPGVMVAWAGSEKVGPKHHRRTAVEHFAGIDVLLEQSSVCVVDATGKIVREAKVASEPERLVRFFRGLGLRSAGSGWRPGFVAMDARRPGGGRV